MSSGTRLEEYRVEITLLSSTRIGVGSEGSLQRLMESQILAVYAFTEAKLSQEGKRAEIYRIKRLPIIPASSIKGVLRTLAERIAAAIYQSYREVNLEAINVEDVPRFLAAMHHQPTYHEEEVRRKNNMIALSPLHAHEEALEMPQAYYDCAPLPSIDAPVSWRYEVFASRYCPICVLFGSSFQAGAVRIRDAIPVDDRPIITTRAHVSINRATRTKSEAMLYSEELVDAGTVFVSRLYILWPLETPEEMEKETCRKLHEAAFQEASALWRMIVSYLKENEVQLGGGKSIGHGLVKIRLRKIR